MEIKAVLFDLDGTLLPMDQDEFVKAYYKLLAVKLAPLGYEPQKLIDSLFVGVKAMIKNDGSKLNEEAFWEVFTSIHGEESVNEKPTLEEFYKNEFHQVKAVCGENADAKNMVHELREKGKKVILATSPLFPAVATKSRMSWAGLSPEDFDYVTTYENCRFTKPNPKYYEELLKVIDCKPEECLMIGNDVVDDMVTKEMGMQVFLLTDCLINNPNADISVYRHGNMEDLKEYLNTI